MSSNRPESSVASSAVEKTIAATTIAVTAEAPVPVTRNAGYIPHVFDLVTPTHRVRDTVKMHIPLAFLQPEAVDSSLFLGNGASFVVTRQALPAGPKYIVERHADMGSWMVEKVVEAPKRPKYVVYKAARVVFNANGEPATPNDRRALRSVLTEMHALLHPPLLDHPNIIDLLGLAWGSNHAQPLYRLPVLVVEYGDIGTLSDLQLRGSPLPDALKLDITLGIARGLQVLHDNGIVHGDVKPENIIMCSQNQSKFIPKLSDFGFAVMESAEKKEVWIPGTKTWRAPECASRVPVELLRLTDVYSFGLMAWSIAVDGQDPFDIIISSDLKGDDRFAEIHRLKSNDLLLGLTAFERWLPSWASDLQRDGLFTPNDDSGQEKWQYQWTESLERMTATFAASGVSDRSTYTAELRRRLEELGSEEGCKQFRSKVFYRDLERLLALTLRKTPLDRNLSAVIDLLGSSENVGVLLSISPKMKFSMVPTHSASRPGRIARKIDWSALGFKHRSYSWQITRDLEPFVQCFAVKTLLHLEDSPSRFALSAFTLNGYGMQYSSDLALEYLTQAAKQGHPIAQACLYRMFKACQKDIPSTVPIIDYLQRQAIAGSRIALQDLKALNQAKGYHTRELLKYGYGGVGALWYDRFRCYHDLTQPMLMSVDFKLSSLGSNEDLPEVVVNHRGDRLVHAAAAVGAHRLLQELITDIKVGVNQLNANGETALVCACRSGHPEIVKLLLDSGADASIQARNGESVLHWLVSFDDKVDPRKLGKDLIDRGGAVVDASTTERVCHSIFPGSIDIDFQLPGTPLQWAIHDNKPHIVAYLLSVGADPNWRFQGTPLSPIEWAAFFHHVDCLRIIIDHLEKLANVPRDSGSQKDPRYAVLYGPLVKNAVHSSDRFSMVLRNGEHYLEKFRSTLALLQEKTKLVSFGVGQNETLLHYAALEGHEEACELILQSGWLKDEINTPAGPAGRTPILESVRWNRRGLFRTFREHGADLNILSFSPYEENTRCWSTLHIFAEQAHNDISLVDDILESGVSIDGACEHSLETPFNVAVRRNAFTLADHLLTRGAAIDATSTKSSLIVSPYPLTGLGHIIALNARYCFDALRYMLSAHPGIVPSRASFVVEQARGLTALHLCALVPHGLTWIAGEPLEESNFDRETNRYITHAILESFREPEHLNWRCNLQDKTALHLAAEYGKSDVLVELVTAGADKLALTDAGETPAGIARRVLRDKLLDRVLAWLE